MSEVKRKRKSIFGTPDYLTTIQLYVSKEMKKALKRYCFEMDVSASKVVRDCLEKLLKPYQEEDDRNEI